MNEIALRAREDLITSDDLEKTIKLAMSILIVDDVSRENGLNICNEFKILINKIKGAMKELLEPIRQTEKDIRNIFNVYIDKLEDADKIVIGKLIAYKKTEDEEKRKADNENLKKMEKAMKTGKAVNLEPTIEVKSTERLENGTVTYQKFFNFKILDEAKIPRQFLSVNETAIREAVKMGIRTIPGVQVFEDQRIVRRP
jgi:hypothetical protein